MLEAKLKVESEYDKFRIIQDKFLSPILIAKLKNY